MNRMSFGFDRSAVFQPTLWTICRIFLTLLVILFTLTGCNSAEQKSTPEGEHTSANPPDKVSPVSGADILYFGFDLRGSAQEDAKQYLPFLDYLQKATGLPIELRFTLKNSSMVNELCSGTFHFGAIGADTYLQAHAACGVIPLVRGLNSSGRAEYQSVIIVHPDSPIQNLDELRGKSFAFGSVTSTQGHLIPRILLAERNIYLDDFAKHEFTGSHQNCANAVASGRMDAGGMQDLLARRLAAEGFIRILHTSEFYPSSGIAVNPAVPEDIQQKVKQALIDFKPADEHAEGLYHWDRTEMALGFSEARDEDYSGLRIWSIKFGLLKETVKEKPK